MKNSEWHKIFTFSRPYLRGQWGKFAAMLTILVTGGIATNFTPYIWGEILDAITNGQIRPMVTGLVVYFAITYAALALSYVEGYLGSKLNYAVETRIKQELMDKVLHMRCADLDRFDTGKLVSRVTSDCGSVITFVFEVITSIVTITINILAALFFAFHISLRLSFISIAFIPLSIFSNFVFKKAFRELNILQRKYGDRQSSFLVGTLGHIPEMKAYCLEQKQSVQYDSLIREGWVLQKKQFFLNTKMSLVSSAISSSSTIAVLIMSTILIAQKRFTIGNLVSFQRYIGQLTDAVSSLLQMNYSAQSAGVAVDRMEELFAMEAEKNDRSQQEIHISHIEFQDVTFAYPGHENILNHIRFSIDKPGIYAIVGENGSGKTTILKLLMRYYTPQSGTILLNGRDVEEYPVGNIRKSMGYFAKDVYIQSGTLLSNLLLGTPFDSEETVPPKLEGMCRRAGLAELIDSLPEGLQTNVGENGKLLSSGQRQKIAIVRALLTNAQTILFDEITSDLDGDAEGKIIETLAKTAGDKMILFVTHRVLPLRAARQILVLEDGRIEAVGSHEQLLQTSLTYQKLFKEQLRLSKESV